MIEGSANNVDSEAQGNIAETLRLLKEHEGVKFCELSLDAQNQLTNFVNAEIMKLYVSGTWKSR